MVCFKIQCIDLTFKDSFNFLFFVGPAWYQPKIFFDPLTSEEECFIMKDLGEDVEQLRRDVEHIQNWLKQEPHLPDDVGKWF